MKHLITTLSILTLLTTLLPHQTYASSSPAPVAQTGQTTCYNAAGTAITCSGTGQDGELQKGVAWPNPRFSDNGDQTMTDMLTGLIWSKNANPAVGAKTWQGALDYIKTLNSQNYQGHNDWRLPNINELSSMVNHGQSNSSTWLNGQGFPNVQGTYWSATTYAYSTDSAWVVDVFNGGVGSNFKANIGYVWPVRSGQSGAIGSLSLSKTGQTKCYNANGSTITCSGTGQDGELQIGTTWPTPRFTDNSLSNSTENTVTDNLTRLVWSKNANLAAATKTWQGALDYVKTLNSINFYGHNDWRLPNSNELSSMVNHGQSNSSTWLNGQGFSNVQSNVYWSATTGASNSGYAWVVGMSSGGVVGYNKANNFYVWPVRSGQSGALDSLTLSVAISGTGIGTVTSSTGGINCGSTCSASITTGTSVTLTASPDSGSTFTGWTGSCSGTDACTLTMDAAKNVTATFTLTTTNGACGSSNGGTFTIAPTADFCTTGTSSSVTGIGPWSWTCSGANGGATANCNAAIATTIRKSGDCDSNGTVTISEVQSAINMFLGLNQVVSCVDEDFSGSVSIAEVQKTINSFLGTVDLSVNGVVSVGSALAGGTVTLKDSSSLTIQKTATIASDGSYSIDVTGLTAPFLLKATGNLNDTSYTLYSFATTGSTCNINPLTHLVVTAANGGQDPISIFNAPTLAQMQAISTALPAALNAIQTKLAPLFSDVGVSPTNVITDSYKADHKGIGRLLELTSISVVNGKVSIFNTIDGSSILAPTAITSSGFAGELNTDNIGTSQKTCTGGRLFLSGVGCICPQGTSLQYGICWQPNTTPTPSICSSIVTNIPDNTGTCTGGQLFLSGIGCVCPAGENLINCVCTQPCGGGQILVNNSSCECPSGQSIVNGVCACSGGQVFINKACQCPTGESLVNGVCQTQLSKVDCQVSNWTSWSSCSSTCGGGTQTHTRAILTQPANGGLACPVISEQQSCNTQACVIGVTGSWSLTGTAPYQSPGCSGGSANTTLTLSENNSGQISGTRGSRPVTGSRNGLIVLLTEQTSAGARGPYTWTWDGANNISGTSVSLCFSGGNLISEMTFSFTGTRSLSDLKF